MLLLHFSDGREVNFPFFIRRSLYKVARGVHSTTKNAETSLCHHSIINTLVFHELSRHKKSWESFLKEISPSEENKIKGGERLTSP